MQPPTRSVVPTSRSNYRGVFNYLSATAFYLDETVIPHSWYSKETRINDLLYISWLYGDTERQSILSVPSRQYDGPDLLTALKD